METAIGRNNKTCSVKKTQKMAIMTPEKYGFFQKPSDKNLLATPHDAVSADEDNDLKPSVVVV